MEKYKVMNQELNYYLAQKLAEALLAKSLISAKEFATITELNRANFKPFLVELLPEIRC